MKSKPHTGGFNLVSNSFFQSPALKPWVQQGRTKSSLESWISAFPHWLSVLGKQERPTELLALFVGREPSLAWRCLPLQGQWSRVQSCLPTQGGFLRFPGSSFPTHKTQKAEQAPHPSTRLFLWSSGCSVFPPLSSALDATL